MEQALTFFRTYEFWIYGVLCLGAFLYARKFFLAWHELRGAAFGLERNNAQGRLNQSASMMVLLLTIAIAVFILVSFIAPSFPGALPLLTPTLNVMTTSTAALETQVQATQGTPDLTPDTPPTETANGCIPGIVEISSPITGTEVKDRVPVVGTVDIENFGFYKLESRRSDETTWVILLAGNQPVKNGELGIWDTRRLIPGEYQLSVVPVDNAATTLSRCLITIRVASPSPETPEP